MVDLFWPGRHVKRGACDRLENLPPSPKTRRSCDQVGIKRYGRIGALRLLWGADSTLLLPDNMVEQTFLAFVVGGMCAGALVSLSYYLPALLAYVYFSALPLAAIFLLDGRTVY